MEMESRSHHKTDDVTPWDDEAIVPSPEEISAWRHAADEVCADPALRENLLQSVLTSMAHAGFKLDPTRATELLDEALDGPPLILPPELPKPI